MVVHVPTLWTIHSFNEFITLPLGCPQIMCLVKTLLEKTLWEKILVKEKEYTYLLIRTICCLIKNLARKTQWGKTSIKVKRVQRVLYSPWLKHHLISCDDVSNLRTLWLVYSFLKEKPHISWIWCVIYLNQTQFLLASWRLLFLHSNICFINRQDIIMPPHANT